MIRHGLWAAISMLALATCGGTQAPSAEPAPHSPAASDAPSSDSTAGSTTEDVEPTDASGGEELLDEWAKHAKGTGADPFPDDVVGFALGMDEAQVRQVCANAKGEIVATQPLRCRLDRVLRKVFKGTTLWLDEPRRGWADGGVSIQLDDTRRVCGISVGLSGSDVGSVVPPSNLIGKLGPPLKVLDVREARVARWHWSGPEHEAFAGWSHHLPSFQGSAGQRKWVSYCKRKILECKTFCSRLE